MMTINEVRDIKIGDTVVFNGGNSAVDNEEGDVWTESFEDKKSCFDWLEHKEKTV